MTITRHLHARFGVALAALLIVLTFASCDGGSVGSGGTGAPVQGATLGTVNGFGSVIVDGLSYDNRGVAALAESAPGVDQPADLKLGQRVALAYDASGVASAVRVEAAVVGPVASVDSSAQLTVLGQRVSVNADGRRGPITQFGSGYASIADIRAGDSIEVHGLLLWQSGLYSIQATRIDKLAAAPTYLRVSGLVSALTPGVQLTLGTLTVDLTGAVIVPAGTALAGGQAVTVWALPATLAVSPNGPRLRAAQVRVRTWSSAGLEAIVSGAVAHLDTSAKTFSLGGLLVRYANATLTPVGSMLAEGQYVQASGAVADDGTLTAASVAIRDVASDSDSELKGNVVGYVAATQTFSVRGVAVDASTATVHGCPATGLATGLYVEVEGSISSSGVIARSISCEDEPSGATIERQGTASAVDAVGQTFTLSSSQAAPLIVQWSASTYFSGVSAQTLTGQRLTVEGTMNGSVLMASRIGVDD